MFFGAEDMKKTSNINIKPQSEKYLQLTKIQASRVDEGEGWVTA